MRKRQVDGQRQVICGPAYWGVKIRIGRRINPYDGTFCAQSLTPVTGDTPLLIESTQIELLKLDISNLLISTLKLKKKKTKKNYFLGSELGLLKFGLHVCLIVSDPKSENVFINAAVINQHIKENIFFWRNTNLISHMCITIAIDVFASTTSR